MKRIKYSILALTLLLAGCESFLDTENYTKKDTSNFPFTQTDAVQMVTGIYSTMNNAVNSPDDNPFFIYEMAGDDRVGGGSTSNRTAQSADRLINSKVSWFENIWTIRYSGIFRSNNAIATMDNVRSWTTNGKKEQLLGEAHFLRAFFYFDMVQLFGSVPLILETVPKNLPKSPAEDIYAQIASDLVKAIEYFPSVKYPDFELGHATKWSAEALIARVYLFYTGFYGKTELPVAGSDKKIGKADVIAYLEDCINNSGHDLLSDQRNLWPYSNPNTAPYYEYAKDKGLSWAGDNNQEVLFALGFSNTTEFSGGDHPLSSGYANRIVEYFNPRKAGDAKAYPFVPTGYSNGPASSKLWSDWAADPDYKGDYRREGTICERAIELPDYAGDPSKEVENTGLLCKKYLGCGAYNESGTLYQSYAYFYGGQNDKQLGLTQSLIFIRFADVLLMHSEIAGTAEGINKVRSRAGLPAVQYSLDALKKERRYELCFEALRWNDLRRWGDVQQIVTNQTGQAITNRGVNDTYAFDAAYDFMTRYNATKGFWKIPDSQITLSEGVLEQNEGWDEASSDWTKLPYSTL
ncbi:MAG: RagB/SusD family nutrient uptake outer membrane protein [Prolixibacteraceae bacterium]|nr:RagB/SusD family nutrient uptake outer membrane protein [Prolixibacteraceae bacterium]